MALLEFITLVKKFEPEVFVQDFGCSRFLKEFIIRCLQQKPIDRANSMELMVIMRILIDVRPVRQSNSRIHWT